MYTETEQKILEHTIHKVQELFTKYPVPAHSFDHAETVAKFARQIAVQEKARSIFLCELAGYLHDIGHASEKYGLGYEKNTHHELSYYLLSDWFKDDEIFSELTAEQKKELLYSVRNHWNNCADTYDTAWILRDADKLHLFGEKGLARQLEYNAPDEKKISLSLRFAFESYYWFKTKTARQIIAENNMMAPVEKYYEEFLKERIKEVDYE